MEEVERKVESSRIYDGENEKVRIKIIKALGYLANSYRQLKKYRSRSTRKGIQKLEDNKIEQEG